MEVMFLPALVNRCDVCFLQLVLGICVFFSLVGPSFIFHGCVFSLLVWPNSERVLLCFDFQRRCCGFPRDMCIEFLMKKRPKEQTGDEKFDRDTPLALHVHTKRKNTPNRVLSLCRRRRSLLWCRLEELVNTSGKCG